MQRRIRGGRSALAHLPALVPEVIGMAALSNTDYFKNTYLL